MLNAYGNEIKPKSFTKKEANTLLSSIVDKISVVSEVKSIMLVGSTTEHGVDPYTDLDLRIFSKTKKCEDLKFQILEKYKQLGAKKDNFKSIHSPFDDFSFQFGNIYVENECLCLSDLTHTINKVLHGKISDDGLIYSMRP